MIKPIDEMSSDELHEAANDNMKRLTDSLSSVYHRTIDATQQYPNLLPSSIVQLLMKL